MGYCTCVRRVGRLGVSAVVVGILGSVAGCSGGSSSKALSTTTERVASKPTVKRIEVISSALASRDAERVRGVLVESAGADASAAATQGLPAGAAVECANTSAPLGPRGASVACAVSVGAARYTVTMYLVLEGSVWKVAGTSAPVKVAP